MVYTTEYISLQEMKQGQCICPLSWSVHCNFTGDGKCNKRGWACTPHPHQPRQILPSWLNVRQKADVTSLCTLWGWQGNLLICREGPGNTLLCIPTVAYTNVSTHEISYISYIRVKQCLSSRPNWDTPTPLLMQASVSPPEPKGGHTRRGWRGGGPNLDDWRKSLALCLYIKVSPPPNEKKNTTFSLVLSGGK